MKEVWNVGSHYRVKGNVVCPRSGSANLEERTVVSSLFYTPPTCRLA